MVSVREPFALALEEGVRVNDFLVPDVPRSALQGGKNLQLRRAEALDVQGAVSGGIGTQQGADGGSGDATQGGGRGLDVAGVEDQSLARVQVEVEEATPQAIVKEVATDDGRPGESAALGRRELLALEADERLIAVELQVGLGLRAGGVTAPEVGRDEAAHAGAKGGLDEPQVLVDVGEWEGRDDGVLASQHRRQLW